MSMVYVSLWMSLSGAVIMYNNWILVFYDFPFPVTLTMWHMGFSSVLATICVKAGWIPGEKKMTSEVYLRTVLPGAILFAGKHHAVSYPHRKSAQALYAFGCSLTPPEDCMGLLGPFTAPLSVAIP